MKKKILIVEDNLGDVQLIDLILKQSGLQIDWCLKSDGEQALRYLDEEILVARSLSVAAIILDLNLPRLGGLQVLKAIRADDRFCEIPVIVFSSSSFESDIEAAYSLKADDYVLKGINLVEFRRNLLSSLKYWLGFSEMPSDFTPFSVRALR